MFNKELFEMPSNPLKHFRSYRKYIKKYRIEHFEEFPYNGMIAIVGEQGSGKTLLAVDIIYRLKKLYPKIKIVSNVVLNDYPFNNIDTLYYKENKQIIDITNGELGTVYLVDEVQTYMGNLTKGNINTDLYGAICQERKAHKILFFTAQKFNRLDKKLREQVSHVVFVTNTFLPFLKKVQVALGSDIMNNDVSGEQVIAKCIKQFYFITTPEMFNRYDTFYKVKTLDYRNGEDLLNDD